MLANPLPCYFCLSPFSLPLYLPLVYVLGYHCWDAGASALAGAMLIIIGPVEPGMDRVYIGRTFAVVVLAGLGSMTGTLAAGLILGISESIVLMHFGASWAPAVSFGLLLIVLGIRPQGLFGR